MNNYLKAIGLVAAGIVGGGVAGRVAAPSHLSSTQASLNVFPITAYGAIPNDGLDDTVAIQAAIDAAKVGAGEVFAGPGDFHFTYINLSDISTGLVFRGSGGPGVGTLNTGSTRLICTRNDNGVGVRIGSSQNILLSRLTVCYDHLERHPDGAFTGDLVYFGTGIEGGGVYAHDSAHCILDQCYFTKIPQYSGGNPPEPGIARSLVCTNQAIITRTQNCRFWGAKTGYLGRSGGHTYAVKNTIWQCEFNRCAEAAIKNPGSEAISIYECTFEPASDESPQLGVLSGIKCEAACNALLVQGNWGGDIGTDSDRAWVDVGVQGCKSFTALGNRWASGGPSSSAYRLSGTQGFFIHDHWPEGGYFIDFAGACGQGTVVANAADFCQKETFKNIGNAAATTFLSNTGPGGQAANPDRLGFGNPIRIGHIPGGHPLGFFDAKGDTRPTVTGKWSDGTAGKELMKHLASLNLVYDQTQP